MLLAQFNKYDFVGFNWQVLYKDTFSVAGSDGGKSHYQKSTIDINIKDAERLYKNGIFPKIKHEISFVKTFHNSCWGHYCINKDLWMLVNGIDEVATNTRHYADLDLNTRL